VKQNVKDGLEHAARKVLAEIDENFEIIWIDFLDTRFKIRYKRLGGDNKEHQITVLHAPYYRVLSGFPFLGINFQAFQWFEAAFSDDPYYKEAIKTKTKKGILAAERWKKTVAGEIVLNAFTLRCREQDKYRMRPVIAQ
jgi:hypothetical protein